MSVERTATVVWLPVVAAGLVGVDKAQAVSATAAPASSGSSRPMGACVGMVLLRGGASGVVAGHAQPDEWPARGGQDVEVRDLARGDRGGGVDVGRAAGGRRPGGGDAGPAVAVPDHEVAGSP